MSTGKSEKSKAAPEDVFPIAVLIKGRKCLVVGAGKTGRRKALSLLEAGANVVIVAPDAVDALKSVAGSKTLTLRKRSFRPADLDGVFIVFAATDDGRLNQKVLKAAARRGVLCGIVDKGWREGDFISPAVIRRDGLTVAVSTGGRSCRRSRMVKENIGRHIDAVSGADLLVIGTSHRYLSLKKREQFHIDSEQAKLIGAMLARALGVHEFALLCTCNRLEIHASASPGRETEGLILRVLGLDRLKDREYYILRGHNAFDHACALLAGRLSQAIGESHIVAQVKDAYRSAVEAGWANGVMKEWLSSALHVSKHIRKEAGSLIKNRDVEDICVDYLASRRGGILSGRIMVIGCGVMGRGVVKGILDRGKNCHILWCYNKRRPRVHGSETGRVELVSAAEMWKHLGGVFAVVCAASGPAKTLDAGHAQYFDRKAKTLIVDLGAPRNVSPDIVGPGENIELVDLDGLAQWRGLGAAGDAKSDAMAAAVCARHRSMYLKIVQ